LTYTIGGLTLADILFRWKVMESRRHSRGEDEIYVTDLLVCTERMSLRKKHPEVEVSDPLDPVTLEGDIVHKGVEVILRDMLGGIVDIETEVDVEARVGGYTLKGRIDMVVDGRVGVEVKHARGDYGIPHEHHILQARIYKWMSKLDEFELLYVTRDRAVSLPVHGSITEEDILRIISEGRLPKKSWVCEHCGYSFACPYKIPSKRRR